MCLRGNLQALVSLISFFFIILSVIYLCLYLRQSASAGGMALCHYLFLSSHSWSFWSLSMPEGTRMLWFKSRCLVVMRQIAKRFCLLLTCLNFWQICQCPLWRTLRGRSLRTYAGDWAFLRAGLYRRKGKLGTTAYSLIIAGLVANVRFLKLFFSFQVWCKFFWHLE